MPELRRSSRGLTGDGRLTAKDAYGKTGDRQSHREAAFSENYVGKMVWHAWYKMVHYPGRTYGELYDLEEDPMPLPVRPDHQDMAPRQYELRHGGTRGINHQFPPQ